MYHSILDNPQEAADSIGIGNIHATRVFRKQMEVLARKYHPVTIEDIRLFLTEEKPMPARAVAITFDDGYADNAEVAAPVLNELGIPASFYVTVGPVDTGGAPWFCRVRHAFAKTKRTSWVDPCGRAWVVGGEAAQRRTALSVACEHLTHLVGSAREAALQTIERDLDTEQLVPKERLMMTWEQVRRLHRDGHVVGSHSLTHPNMARIADDNLRYELKESKRRIEAELGVPVVHFAYPGTVPQSVIWTEHTVAATEEAGYRTAVTTIPGPVTKGDRLVSLRRIGSPHEIEEFTWVLQYAPLNFKSCGIAVDGSDAGPERKEESNCRGN